MKLVMLGLLIVMGGVGGVEQSTTNLDFLIAGIIAGVGLYITYTGVKQIAE